MLGRRAVSTFSDINANEQIETCQAALSIVSLASTSRVTPALMDDSLRRKLRPTCRHSVGGQSGGVHARHQVRHNTRPTAPSDRRPSQSRLQRRGGPRNSLSVCVKRRALPNKMVPRRSASTAKRARIKPLEAGAHDVTCSEADGSATEDSPMMTTAHLEHLAGFLNLPCTVHWRCSAESPRITTIAAEELTKKLTPPSFPEEVLSALALTNVVQRGPRQRTNLRMVPAERGLLDPAIRRHGSANTRHPGATARPAGPLSQESLRHHPVVVGDHRVVDVERHITAVTVQQGRQGRRARQLMPCKSAKRGLDP